MDPNLARTPLHKTALRAALIARRADIPPEIRRSAEHTMAQHVVALLQTRRAQRVAAFYAIRGEPQLATAWTELRSTRVAIALPVVETQNAAMVFRAWDGAALIKPDAARVPAPIHSPIVAPLDALVVPCVGYNTDGFRLGYGGGYFDRTLQALDPKPFTIGVAFAVQQTEFAVEAHDVGLDAIVTELGVTLFR